MPPTSDNKIGTSLGSDDSQLLESGIADRQLLNQDMDEDTPDEDTEDVSDESESDAEQDDLSDEGTGEEKDEEEGEEESEIEESDEDEDESEDSGGDEDSLLARLNKVAPDALKKIPELKAILNDNREYQEVFSTPDEAKVASEQVQIFNQMQQKILQGDAGSLLKVIKQTNDESYVSFAHDFIDALGKDTPEVYSSVLTNPVRKILRAAYVDGKKADNKNLYLASVYLHRYIFDNDNIEAPLEERRSLVKKTPEMEKFEKDRAEFDNRKTQEFGSGIEEIIMHTMQSDISKELKKFSSLNDYTRGKIAKDIFEGIDSTLKKDSRHITSMDSLIRQARSAGFTTEWKTRIAKAWLHRAKMVLPDVRRKILSQAGVKVKSMGKENVTRLAPNASGRGDSGGINFNKVDKSKTSDMDILNDKPTYKK